MTAETIACIISAGASAIGTGGMASIAIYLMQRSDRRKDKKNHQQELIEEGLLAVLHDRLYQACRYHLRKGWTTIEEMNNIKHLYGAYHNLGGNGTGTELYERCMDLPLQDDDFVK